MADFEDDLMSIFVAAGIGAEGVVIFHTSNAKIPTANKIADLAFLSFIVTGGRGPEYTQNRLGPSYQKPGAQITGRHIDPGVAKRLCRSGYDAIASITNHTVSGGQRYLRIRPLQEPFDEGPDGAGRTRYTFNVFVEHATT